MAVGVSILVVPRADAVAVDGRLVLGHLGLGLVALVVATASGGDEVEEEGGYEEGEDEGDDPFEDGGDVVVVEMLRGAKGWVGFALALVKPKVEKGRFMAVVVRRHTNCESNFDQDEEELDPERGPKNAVLAISDTKTLVFGADENGGHDVAGDEDGEESIVEMRVPQGVEDGEQDEACRADDRGNARDDGEDLLRAGRIRRQSTVVTKPALGEECEVERYDGHGGHGDEERF